VGRVWTGWKALAVGDWVYEAESRRVIPALLPASVWRDVARSPAARIQVRESHGDAEHRSEQRRENHMMISTPETSWQTGTPAVCSTDLLCPVSVLFARHDSIYKTLPGCDLWDAQRDATKWGGGNPVIAHPPCRAWGRLAHFANPPPGEREYAVWSVQQIRKWGGVLEHPAQSRLWGSVSLPKPGHGRDEWGGWSMSIDQHWWGHRANKETWLYVCGCEPAEAPKTPLRIDEGTHYIMRDRRRGTASRNWWKRRLPTREREATPEAFARWLVELARRCKGHNEKAHA
jgi:hypothetical protein